MATNRYGKLAVIDYGKVMISYEMQTMIRYGKLSIYGKLTVISYG